HSKYEAKRMQKYTGTIGRERLDSAIDELTEEHRRYVLGVLEALCFAQAAQEQRGNNQNSEFINTGGSYGDKR
ncbi:MAG: hypothetical protein LBL19_07845, partial [Spirochaetaceae bacterium]|nr:hypothetical protein [Spirochaetaceae bacterium]